MNDDKAEFMNKGFRLTNYSAIPNGIYEMNISSTAMVLYARLLSRAQLSVANDYIDEDGRAYVLYTQEELANELHISISAVKNNLNELLKAGLIEKKRSDNSRANMIFVKVPVSSIYSQKTACKQTENELLKGSKTVPSTVRNVAAINYKYKPKLIPDYKYVEGESL